MEFKVIVPASLKKFLDCLNPSGRRYVYSGAAAAVSDLVRRHIAEEAQRRHFHTLTDGKGDRTLFIEKAARKTVFHSDETHGEVVIPSPGFGRALHDVMIHPTKAASLTLPISEFSYGHRVKEMQSMGWRIFRPKGKDVLMGSREGDETAIPLYMMKKRVKQVQDRTLLPSDAAISTTASKAMISEINRIAKVA